MQRPEIESDDLEVCSKEECDYSDRSIRYSPETRQIGLYRIGEHQTESKQKETCESDICIAVRYRSASTSPIRLIEITAWQQIQLIFRGGCCHESQRMVL
uniref:Uncharacterized protein n=1 Tax=Steinernema glaseri TaxID=37863 RepID=A0A1I7ZSJ3_9BILA